MHPYWLDGSIETRTGGGRHYDFDKAFHVSPFMPMDCRYRFGFTDPGDSLVVQVTEWLKSEFSSAGPTNSSSVSPDDRAGVGCNSRPVFDATLRLEREPWSAAALHRALFRHPWMTLKVIAAIHWQALRLWVKRVPVFTHPKKLAGKEAAP